MKKLILLFLFPMAAFAQQGLISSIPDCSAGFCSGLGVPTFHCNTGQKYAQIDNAGTNFTCTGIPPQWTQDKGDGTATFGSIGSGTATNSTMIVGAGASLTSFGGTISADNSQNLNGPVVGSLPFQIQAGVTAYLQGTGLVKLNGSVGPVIAIDGTDYLSPATGAVKSSTSTQAFIGPISTPQLLVSKANIITPQVIRGIVGAFAGQSTTNGATYMDIFPVGYNPWLAGITFEDYATSTFPSAAIVLGLANDTGDSQGINFTSVRASSFDDTFNLFTHNGVLTWNKTGDSANFGQTGTTSDIEVSTAMRFGWDNTNQNALLTGGGTAVPNAGVALGINNGGGSTNFTANYAFLCDKSSGFCGIGSQQADASLNPWRVNRSTGDMTAHAGTFNSVVTPTTTIGTGTALTRYARFNASLTFSAVAASSCTVETPTVTGVAAGDFLISVVKPSVQAGLVVGQGIVTGANAVSFPLCNVTIGSITPTASELYQFVVVQ